MMKKKVTFSVKPLLVSPGIQLIDTYHLGCSRDSFLSRIPKSVGTADRRLYSQPTVTLTLSEFFQLPI